MKVFWSWQSDTPGKIGRHFVRDALSEAIDAIKEAPDIEEPTEREAREALHLDQDRQGIAGSPDLAPTIFKKIEQAAVFVADVTLIGESIVAKGTTPKKLINSNVAIEFGYALHSVTDTRILMVQNVHFGDREQLPFDLKHKAGPIQFRLAPDASKEAIIKEKTQLRSALIAALKPYIGGGVNTQIKTVKFEETPSTTCPAFYWTPGEVLASYQTDLLPLARRTEEVENFEYRFDEPDAFYLRLIPTAPLLTLLPVTLLNEAVRTRRVQVLTRGSFGYAFTRNRFGAITYQQHGNSTVPTAFTQLFRNGEIWGVTREFVGNYYGSPTVAMENVHNISSKALENFIRVAIDAFGMALPFTVELGAVGLKNKRLSLPASMRQWHNNDLSAEIYENELSLRRVLNDAGPAAQNELIQEFSRQLYDLAGVNV